MEKIEIENNELEELREGLNQLKSKLDDSVKIDTSMLKKAIHNDMDDLRRNAKVSMVAVAIMTGFILIASFGLIMKGIFNWVWIVLPIIAVSITVYSIFNYILVGRAKIWSEPITRYYKNLTRARRNFRFYRKYILLPLFILFAFFPMAKSVLRYDFQDINWIVVAVCGTLIAIVVYLGYKGVAYVMKNSAMRSEVSIADDLLKNIEELEKDE